MAKEARVVRVRSRGQVSSVLEAYAEAYRKKFPERSVRYVYDPENKPELSGVVGRMAAGYEHVTWEDLGMTSDKRPAGGYVRVGDTVLMSIPTEVREEELLLRSEMAIEQRQTVQREYYAEIEKEADAVTPDTHSRAAAAPTGRVSVKEKSFEYEIEQRSDDK